MEKTGKELLCSFGMSAGHRNSRIQLFLHLRKRKSEPRFFAEYVGTLYTLSYAVKMDLKKKNIPGQPDYTVYPLEGVWQFENDTPLSPNGILNKDALIFNLMIRQPDTVSKEYAQEILEHVKKKKANPLWDQVKFEHMTDGLCVQALHIGSYDREAESFAQMEIFAAQQGRIRTGMDPPGNLPVGCTQNHP